MSDLEPSVFTTSILTSKTPIQSATIVDENVKQSTQLNKQLIQFYENYISILQQQNYATKNLLSNQSTNVSKFLNSNKEYGIVENSWNNLHQVLANQVSSNDQLIKFLKLEILGPLMNLTQDIKFSELLINNQELQELVSQNPIDEYKWNTRSVDIFESFKNFKTLERNTIVNQFINLFNFNNSTFEKLHNLNQNNLSHLLESFNIEGEMDNYLNSILNNNYPLLTPKPPGSGHRHQKQKSVSSHMGLGNASSAASTSSKPVSHRQSKLFHSEKDKDKKEKNKLRSRVGSIFGRSKKSRSKNSSGNDLDSLYSNQTNNTTLTNLTNLREDDTVVNNIHNNATYSKPVNLNAHSAAQTSGSAPNSSSYEPVQKHQQHPPQPAENRQLNQLQPPYPPKPSQPQVQTDTPPQPPQKLDQYASLQPQSGQRSSSQQSSSFRAPPQPPQPAQSSPSSGYSNRDLPIIPPTTYSSPESAEATGANDFPPKSPNVIKYSDSSDEEGPQVLDDDGEDSKPIPANNFLNVNKSRHTQYSFESGDDEENFKTSPKVQKSAEFDFPEPDVNGDGVDLSDSEGEDTIGELHNHLPPAYVGGESSSGFPVDSKQSLNAVPESPASSSHSAAPAPPPARKVAHNERRGEIQSQMFHSLPQTRDSIIEQPQMPHLHSQTTGNSLTSNNLRKSEMFHHEELIDSLIPGLNISNSQIINVNFKQDNLAKSSVIGELAFHYHGSEDVVSDDLIIRVPNSWNKTINNTFIEQLNQEDFKFKPSAILNKTLGGIKYMQNNLGINQIPLFIHSIWKYEEHQSSLIISISANPSFGPKVVLNHLQVAVALDTNVQAHSASSKPTGSFNKEKNRVTWKYDNPVTITPETPERLIARFMTNGQGVEDSSGIQVKFSISDLFTDVTCNNQTVNVTGNLNAGNYSSNS